MSDPRPPRVPLSTNPGSATVIYPECTCYIIVFTVAKGFTDYVIKVAENLIYITHRLNGIHTIYHEFLASFESGW